MTLIIIFQLFSLLVGHLVKHPLSLIVKLQLLNQFQFLI